MPHAITIDTCIFENFNLNSPQMLSRLRPLLSREFVLSEIVVMELRAHYETAYKSVHRYMEHLKKDIARFSANPAIQDAITNLHGMLEREKAGDGELNNFIAATDARIVPSSNITLAYVLDAYFKTDAPFRTGKKKSEFPDAIAIYSLDKWAADNGRRIAAISCDNDWLAFAENNRSRWMCFKSIDAAVEKLH